MTDDTGKAKGPGKNSAEDKGGESGGTVIVAIIVNAVIMTAKIFVGLISGSGAMLSEGAHSVADTLNEGFLFLALKRSGRPADAKHPFGYGKERFFWTLIAAVGIFVAGAGFSFLQAYQSFMAKPGEDESYLLSYIVLAASFVLEAVSWTKATRQVKQEARQAGRGLVEHVRKSSDPTVKTVASEDSAALIGLALAAGGLVMHQVTGKPMWEGVASALIGALLCFVAWALARDSKGLLIGEAVDDNLRHAINDHIEQHPDVERVYELLTMTIGTQKVLVAVRLSFVETADATQIEEASDQIARELRESFTQVQEVFLDPTGRLGAQRIRPLNGDGDRAYPSEPRATSQSPA